MDLGYTSGSHYPTSYRVPCVGSGINAAYVALVVDNDAMVTVPMQGQITVFAEDVMVLRQVPTHKVIAKPCSRVLIRMIDVSSSAI